MTQHDKEATPRFPRKNLRKKVYKGKNSEAKVQASSNGVRNILSMGTKTNSAATTKRSKTARLITVCFLSTAASKVIKLERVELN